MRVQQRFPRSDIADRGNQVEALDVLDDISGGACQHRVQHRLFVRIGRQHEAFQLGRTGPQFAGQLPVADRDWFRPPRDRFFLSHTDPPLKVVMTDEDRNIGYGETLFRRVQEIIESGGFHTCDLG